MKKLSLIKRKLPVSSLITSFNSSIVFSKSKNTGKVFLFHIILISISFNSFLAVAESPAWSFETISRCILSSDGWFTESASSFFGTPQSSWTGTTRMKYNAWNIIWFSLISYNGCFTFGWVSTITCNYLISNSSWYTKISIPIKICSFIVTSIIMSKENINIISCRIWF